MSITKIKPTREEIALIRDCAARSAGCARVKLRPGVRHNLDTDKGTHMNIARVTDHPDWDDTDLWHTCDWADFTKGVELIDGRGIFDFYVDGPVGSYWCELKTNVVAYYEGGKLAKITGVGDGVMWRAA